MSLENAARELANAAALLAAAVAGRTDVRVTSGSITTTPSGTQDVNVLDVIPGTGATRLGKARDSAVGATDTGIAMLGRIEATSTHSDVDDGDYDVPSLTDYKEVRTRDQRSIDLCNCNDATAVTVLGNDTINLANSVSHVFGTGALTFDKANGAANTVYAGVQDTFTALDIQEAFEAGGFVGLAAYIPTITNVQNVFLRIGTNSSNYNCWVWDVSTLTAATWLNLRASTASPDKARSLGNGWDTNAITYVAFGCEFLLETDTLAGMIFDHVYMVGGRVTSTDISASISSSISSPNINVHKVGGSIVDHGVGNASSGSQRIVIADDDTNLAAINANLAKTRTPTATATGLTRFRNIAVTNTAVAVKGSAGNIYSINAYNPGVALAYLHIYNVAAASVTVGTTVPNWSIALPSTATGTVGIDAISDIPYFTASGAFSVAASTTPNGGTAPGTALVVNIGYV